MANHAMEIGIVTLLGLMILLGANWLSDRRVSPDLSRRVAGALGGLVFLVAILTLEAEAAIILTFSIAAVIALLRWVARSHLRGLRRVESGSKWSEVALRKVIHGYAPALRSDKQPVSTVSFSPSGDRIAILLGIHPKDNPKERGYWSDLVVVEATHLDRIVAKFEIIDPPFADAPWN